MFDNIEIERNAFYRYKTSISLKDIDFLTSIGIEKDITW